MLILFAGPYRSGTNDDPLLIEKNMENLEAMSIPIFNKGHIPIKVVICDGKTIILLQYLKLTFHFL